MKNYSGKISVVFALFLMALPLCAQSDLSLTVTNSDLALVRETRTIQLKKGIQNFLLKDMPSGIDPTSVLVDAKSNGFQVLEQNYEYDLINVNKVLQKSLDQTIWLVDPQLGMFSGKLLSVSDDYLLLRDDEGKIQIVPRNDQQKVVLRNLDSAKTGFITRPALLWKINAQQQGKHTFHLSYLTGGLNWHADYVGKLNKDDNSMQLAAWVTVKNNSGKTYANARLKLMAGKLNLVRRERGIYPTKMLMKAASAESQFKEKALFEYHLYTLQRPTTLKQNQIKQIQLFPESQVPVAKLYEVTSNNPNKVNVYLSFKNSKANHLGIPLPAGKLRVYKEADGDLEFVGEDRIDHTPKDETVKLKLGTAFDLVSQRKEIKTEKIGKIGRKRTVEYRLRNHKKTDVVITVREIIWASETPKLIASDIKPSTVSGRSIEYKVPVKAGQETRFKFTYYFE